MLARLGADVNIPDNIGTTPVYIAAFAGHANAIRILATLGADVKTPNKDGSTPLNVAIYYKHTDAINVLAEMAAKASSRYSIS